VLISVFGFVLIRVLIIFVLISVSIRVHPCSNYICVNQCLYLC